LFKIIEIYVLYVEIIGLHWSNTPIQWREALSGSKRSHFVGTKRFRA